MENFIMGPLNYIIEYIIWEDRRHSFRKQAYSNILKILQLKKKENFR